MSIEENIPLAPLTTFGIGGAARFFVRVTDVEELREALAVAKQKNLPVLVLGGGSNVLIADEGFDGLVIKMELGGIEFKNETVIAGAGESWDTLVVQTVEKKFWGIENLSGIPGTVGGAVAGNIGAYGQALSQTLVWVEALDTASGGVRQLSNTHCVFDYRDSFFKHDNSRYIILRAAFVLSFSPAPTLSYKDLRERFTGSAEDIEAIREAVLAIRKGKFPDIAREGTAGSFFKNPIVPADDARALKQQYPDMPVFEMPETSGIKIPLAWLLDKVLGLRGFKLDNVRLFERQPLVIVAEKNARARDVRALAEHVETTVREKLGITIEKEVRII